jgi:hypothetical protein
MFHAGSVDADNLFVGEHVTIHGSVNATTQVLNRLEDELKALPTPEALHEELEGIRADVAAGDQVSLTERVQRLAKGVASAEALVASVAALASAVGVQL